MKKAAPLCIIALGLLSAPPPKTRSGSLVVGIFSRNADYVVIGAESRRNYSGETTSADDDACKVISLGGNTLFFDAGTSGATLVNGDAPWDSQSVARDVFRHSLTHDAPEMSAAWAKNAREWFSDLSQKSLEGLAEGPEGYISLGGFVSFTEKGAPSVQIELISYSASQQKLIAEADTPPPAGATIVYGVATRVVRDFFEGKAGRAARASGHARPLGILGVNAEIDAVAVSMAIQFAIDHAGPDKGELGGPIDVAILRKDRTIEWVSRKKECYDLDEKPLSEQAANVPVPSASSEPPSSGNSGQVSPQSIAILVYLLLALSAISPSWLYAKKRGHRPWVWALIALALSFFALLLLRILPDRSNPQGPSSSENSA